MRHMRCLVLVPALLAFLLPQGSSPPLRLVITGDSTVQTYKEGSGKAGWGQCLASFLTDRVTVLNHARSGVSSKSFRARGLWQKALAARGDWLLIQFGHNDCPGKGDRYTDPRGDYRENLRRFIAEARRAGIRPVLVTPVARRTYGPAGRITTTLAPYAEAMGVVAREQQVPLVDLHALSIARFNRLGDRGSRPYSCSARDRSHFSLLGAREIAGLVARGLYFAAPRLRPYLRLPPVEPPATLSETENRLSEIAEGLILSARRPMASGIAAFPPQAGRGYEACG